MQGYLPIGKGKAETVLFKMGFMLVDMQGFLNS